MKQVALKVDGMSCGHCVRAVESALAEVPGVTVEQVQIGSAKVRVEDATTVTSLVDALADAGYSAEELVG